MFNIGVYDEAFGFWTRIADEEGYVRAEMGVIGGDLSGFIVCWVYWDGGLAVGELDREKL